MAVSTFALRVRQCRDRIGEVDARTYHRDREGKFSSGGGGGVRESLANASTVDELNTAVAAEAKRITGQDVRVNFKGADLQVAKEYGEGVLRGMEHSPSTKVSEMQTYGPGGARPARDGEDQGEYANARTAIDDGGETPSTEIGFSAKMAADPTALRAHLADDAKVRDGVRGNVSGEHGPMGIAVHEFGHVAASQVARTHEYVIRDAHGNVMERHMVDIEFEAQDHVRKIVEAQTGSPYGNAKIDQRSVAGQQISSYASWERGELVAEGFADVVLNGDKASALSHDIYAMTTRGSSL